MPVTAANTPDTVRGGTRSAALKSGREWLDSKHAVWTANVDEWTSNERRLREGRDVLSELTRFDYEKSTTPGEGYQARQDQATYVNFPDMFATTIGGHLMENLSSINWGNLGDPVRKPNQAEPSRAELIYYNV